MDVKHILSVASNILKSKSIEAPVREAGVLLAFVMKRDLSWIYAHPEEKLTNELKDAYMEVVVKRSERVPFQYISNNQEFMSLDFYVDENCLIPRPDTEILVEAALRVIKDYSDMHCCKHNSTQGDKHSDTHSRIQRGKHSYPYSNIQSDKQCSKHIELHSEADCDKHSGMHCCKHCAVHDSKYGDIHSSIHHSPIRILDIGTGSGAIAVSIAHYNNNVVIDAIDISKNALEIAKRNAQKHSVLDRIRFINKDFFSFEAAELYSVVISNPPYIPNKQIEHLMPEVTKYEPKLALDGGEDGLYFYRGIASRVKDLLMPGGTVLTEVGIGQDAQVKELFENEGLSVCVYKDLSGINRVVSGSSQI